MGRYIIINRYHVMSCMVGTIDCLGILMRLPCPAPAYVPDDMTHPSIPFVRTKKKRNHKQEEKSEIYTHRCINTSLPFSGAHHAKASLHLAPLSSR